MPVTRAASYHGTPPARGEKDAVNGRLDAASFLKISRQSLQACLNDHVPSMGAAISYYTVFSIAPLLLIVIGVAGLLFGKPTAQNHILGEIGALIGGAGASAVAALLASAADTTKSGFAAGIGVVVLLIGATSVFAELQSSLDRIWRVPAAPRTGGIWSLLRTRLLSFGLILAVGFLLAVSLSLSAALSALATWWDAMFGNWRLALKALNAFTSFGVITVLFAMIYKLLPRATIGWVDVWVGALVTALLFDIGKELIGIYLGTSGVTSAFGAAGSFAVLLLWVYYSAQVFLLGAEFTWCFAHELGSRRGLPREMDGIDPKGR